MGSGNLGKWKVILSAWLFVAAFDNARSAGSAPDVQVRLEGNQQVTSKEGTRWAAFQEGTMVRPGERIMYRLELENRGDQEARNPVAVGPVPAGTTFVLGTATTARNLKVDYSVDSGKTFSESPTVTVTGKDGKSRTIPAPAERYTTVRWTWSSPLAAHERASVTYEVAVR